MHTHARHSCAHSATRPREPQTLPKSEEPGSTLRSGTPAMRFRPGQSEGAGAPGRARTLCDMDVLHTSSNPKCLNTSRKCSRFRQRSPNFQTDSIVLNVASLFSKDTRNVLRMLSQLSGDLPAGRGRSHSCSTYRECSRSLSCSRPSKVAVVLVRTEFSTDRRSNGSSARRQDCDATALHRNSLNHKQRTNATA